ncbi:MAG: hypothetical protein ISR75_00145 [Phycisphaerales bacterium]|nr:hypothetical protein [Phycisphaerales bacterium]
MRMHLLFILFTYTLITGCSTIGSNYQNQAAAKIVGQRDSSNIERHNIGSLNTSFQNNGASSKFSGDIVELTGKVVAFSLTENGLYTVTIQNDESKVVCIFNNSISGKLGDDRAIRSGATVTIQGQCAASGLFSSTSFSLNGCRLVSN